MNLATATISQLLVPVFDFERSVGFYRDVLGLALLFSAPPQMAFFNCGGIRLLVGVTPTGQTPQRGSTIYFKVSDIESVYVYLKERAVHFAAPPHIVNRTPKMEMWLAEFSDPDGNHLALLCERATGSA